MKKLSKVLLASLVALMMMFSFAQPRVYALPDSDKIITNIENESNKEVNTSEDANVIIGKIMNWIWGISIGVAVIVLMIIGLKFILGSTSEKAEYKKSLIPVVVGVLILVFATTIVKVLFSIRK